MPMARIRRLPVETMIKVLAESDRVLSPLLAGCTQCRKSRPATSTPQEDDEVPTRLDGTAVHARPGREGFDHLVDVDFTSHVLPNCELVIRLASRTPPHTGDRRRGGQPVASWLSRASFPIGFGCRCFGQASLLHLPRDRLAPCPADHRRDSLTGEWQRVLGRRAYTRLRLPPNRCAPPAAGRAPTRLCGPSAICAPATSARERMPSSLTRGSLTPRSFLTSAYALPRPSSIYPWRVKNLGRAAGRAVQPGQDFFALACCLAVPISSSRAPCRPPRGSHDPSRLAR